MTYDLWRADRNILAYSTINIRRKGNLSKVHQRSEDKISLVWCDRFIQNNHPDHQHTLEHLRAVNRYVITFIEEKQCLNYINEFQEANRLFLILSGSLGEHFVPQIHHRQQIHSIYIFCGRKSIHEVWARKYWKVKGVFDQITQLRQVLEADKQQLDEEQVTTVIIDSPEKYSSSPANVEPNPNIKDLKYNAEHPSIDNITTSILSSIPSSNSEVEMDQNQACSNTLPLNNSSKQQIESVDTGIWPCISGIVSSHDELVRHLQSAIKPATVNYFHAIESFLEYFRNNPIEPHLIVISNPESLDYVHRLVHPHVRKLYIHCSNDRLAEYDTWVEQHPQLICVLQRFESLSRLIVWDLTDCIRDIGNYYTGQNRNDLAQRRYEYAYRLHITLHGLLNNQRDILECSPSAKLNA